MGIINSSVSKLYLVNSDLSEISDEILYGMAFEIINEVGHEWLYINTEYNYNGYINKTSININDKLCKEWLENRNSVVINNFADILEKDRIQSRILLTLPRGSYLIKTGKLSEDRMYTEVKLVDGGFGWIKTHFIRDIRSLNISEQEFRKNLIEDSLLYLGTQYRWGGKTPEGIDCSGLCSMVYLLNGIKIYRDALIKDGYPIKKIEMMNIGKGDLIYFPGHVAMYIGNSKYIHSSNLNNGVSINSLDKNAYNYREDLAKLILYVGSIF